MVLRKPRKKKLLKLSKISNGTDLARNKLSPEIINVEIINN
jgi:hypothetical protein